MADDDIEIGEEVDVTVVLDEAGETVGTVAEKVGYATPFAFSAAFKRVRGVSPQEHRALAQSAA